MADCYCEERVKHPDAFKDVPEGFCGICDVCGKPGHMRAHPHAPATGAWCDEHFSELAASRPVTLPQIFLILVVVLLFLLTVGRGLLSLLI